MNEFERERRAKLSTMHENGFSCSEMLDAKLTSINVVRDQYKSSFTKDSGPVFSIAGRVLLKRGHGKLSFISLTSDKGDIQLVLDDSRLNPQYSIVRDNIDLGDIIQAEGILCATQKGEISIWVSRIVVIGKALTPPPDKFHGLTDPELRYRQRHVDLWTNPESLNILKTRSVIIKAIRDYMHDSGYMEVETPILQSSAGGAAAKPFITHHNALDIDLYLRIAPELYLKRLLIGGMSKVFEIGKNFRNEGISVKHNPEFTVLEAYEAFGNYESMMELTQRLVRQAASTINSKDYRFPYKDGVIDFGKPFRKVSLDELVPENLSPEEKYRIYEENIESTLMDPTFVTGLPASQVPLAKNDGRYAEVFELVIGGQEIAPGYSEQTDPDKQLDAFRSQAVNGHIMDQEFIDVLKVGMPPSGGMGLGIDRLVAILTNQSNIRDVIAFPTLRPLA